jgi:hypothetical protein
MKTLRVRCYSSHEVIVDHGGKLILQIVTRTSGRGASSPRDSAIETVSHGAE